MLTTQQRSAQGISMLLQGVACLTELRVRVHLHLRGPLGGQQAGDGDSSAA